MDEATYKAFWVGYGVRYAIGAAITILAASVLHAVVSVAAARIWPPACAECKRPL